MKTILTSAKNYSNNNKIYSTALKHFSYKYVPMKKLKFEEINYYEPACKIYELEKPTNKKFTENILTFTSGFMFMNLIYDPFVLNLIFPYFTLIGNIIVQSYLVFKYFKLKKVTSHRIKLIYILQNGKQLLIKTEDDSVHIVNILDLTEVTEDKDFRNLNTYEKEFKMDINLQKLKCLNEEIINAIKEGRIIRTDKSFDNYERFTIQKLEDEYKERIKPKVLHFKLDKMGKYKYLSSYNRFLLIKHALISNRFNKYYIRKSSTTNQIKEPAELTKIKRKLNIHMYSNERFLQKYGVEMYKFLGNLNSAKDEEAYKEILNLIKKVDNASASTSVNLSFGRKIKKSNKNI